MAFLEVDHTEGRCAAVGRCGPRHHALGDEPWNEFRYNEERVANTMLDRADRAIALKFLVHFVGDLHQPFHATAVEAGGNGIRVRVFGSDTCGRDPATAGPCNLHRVWDSELIARRALDDRMYLERLEEQIRQRGLNTRPVGAPADWAIESLALSNAAMLAPGAEVDETYYRHYLPVIEERLALGGVRLAALLNRSLTEAPPQR